MTIYDFREKLQQKKIAKEDIDNIIRKNNGLFSRTSMAMVHKFVKANAGRELTVDYHDELCDLLVSCIEAELNYGGKVVDLSWKDDKKEFIKSDGNAGIRQMDGLPRINWMSELAI